MKTRGKSSAKSTAKGSTKTATEAIAAATASTAPKVTLQPESTNPPKLFILPKDTTPEARVVNLANPRTSIQTRYLWCPQKGFYEFIKVSAPKTTPRSWLLCPSESDEKQKKRLQSAKLEVVNGEYNASTGYVTKTADIFIATPIDPLFLILPALAPPPSGRSAEPAKRLFLAGDDYFDAIISASPHFGPLLCAEFTRGSINARMAVVCDTVQAGGETMYRINEEKLLRELLQKAGKMATAGLPASMEEKLVRKALEIPIMCLKREEGSTNELGEEKEAPNLPRTLTTATDGVDSTALSTETVATSASLASTAATSLPEDGDPSLKTQRAVLTPIDAPEGIPHLLRLRTALTFITASYIPAHLDAALDTILASPSSSSSCPGRPDFAPLTAHLAHLAQLRQQELAARSLSNIVQKRALNEDGEDETRAEKRRKKEEEERRKKASESRGMRDLKKVDVRGMKKMSDFFKRK